MDISFGFHPLASLLMGLVVFLGYSLFLRMKLPSSHVQRFIAMGMWLITASLFFRLRIVTEPPAMPEMEAGSASDTAPFDLFASPPAYVELPVGGHASNSVSGLAAVDWNEALYWCVPYYVVVASFALLFIAGQLFYLSRVRRRAKKTGKIGEATVFQTDYETPFSFARSIFLPKLMDHEKEAFVLAHEESHIRRKHFYKLLWMQCLSALNWFNPFVYLLFRAMRLQQEMEADRDVLDQGFDREQYQIHLVLTCKEANRYVPASTNYNKSMLEMRIISMNNPADTNILMSAVFVIVSLLYFAMQSIEHYKSGNGEPNDLVGCWSLESSGDSAFRTRQSHDVSPTIKLYGRKHVLAVVVTSKHPNGMLTFSGRMGQFRSEADSLYVEFGERCPVSQVNPHTFDLTWLDNYADKRLPGVWRTERWRQCPVEGNLRYTLMAYRESQQDGGKFGGVWRLTAVKTGEDGAMRPFGDVQLKICGNYRYATLLLHRAYDSEGGRLYQFRGNCGRFEYVDDNLVRENGEDFHIAWIDGDTFSAEYVWAGLKTYEMWTRIQLPNDIKQMLADMGL